MSNAELARLLAVSEAWTTRRLGKRADTTLNLVDIQRIAAAMDTPLTTFFTPEIRDSVPTGLTAKYPAVAVRSAFGDRPRDNRPNGRAVAATAPAGGRTTYLDRPRRRRKDR